MKTSVSCDQCRLQIASLAEATLSSGASSSLPEAVASHLENCAECRFEYSILKDIAGELRALPFHEAPPNLRLRVRAQIDREQFAAKNVRRFPLLKMPRWASFSLSGAGVAACLLFLIAQHPDKFSQSETFPETATTETATTETDTNDAENASISAHKIPSKITSAPTAAPKPRAARPTQNAATLKQRFAPENGAAASQNDTSSTGNETYAAPDSTNNSTRNALSPMPLLRAPSPIQKSLSNGAARSISQNGAARLEFLPPDADRAKILRNRSVSPSSSKSANEGSVNESSVNQESARGGARDTKRGQNSPSNSNASTAPVVGSTPPQNFSAPMQGVSPTITAPAPSAPSAPQHDTTQNGSHLDGGNQLSSQSLRARKTTDAASTQNAASQNNSDQQNATAPDATAQGKSRASSGARDEPIE